jgi:DNA-binding transcriptional ArsR family regulator
VVSDSQAQDIDVVLHALADPTRRDILVRALQGEESVSALARRYPMSFPAVHKHVAVLERANLVTKRRNGREQLVSGNVAAVRTVARFVDELEAVWRARVDRMAEVLRHEQGDRP